MPDIKMIVTDLDGTLLREDKTISEYSVQILEKCRAKGIKFAYATGRGLSADIITAPLTLDGRIKNNGAIAHAGNKVIYNKLIPIDEVRELLLKADAAGYYIVAESNNKHYANYTTKEKWPWLGNYEETDFKTLNIQIEKVYALAKDPDVLALMNRYLYENHYIYVARDDIAMLMHKEATKAKAVAALAGYWGIDAAEIVAFGDDVNDLDMLEYCGHAVVVENGLDEAKACADEICGGNEEDGVARWLAGVL